MNSLNLSSALSAVSAAPPVAPAKPPVALTSATAAKAPADNPRLHKAFNDFVGETFYGQMLQAMRKSQGKPAYFHGGRAEEIFTQQLDQVLTKKMSEAGAAKLSGPMYKLFTQTRR